MTFPGPSRTIEVLPEEPSVPNTLPEEAPEPERDPAPEREIPDRQPEEVPA